MSTEPHDLTAERAILGAVLNQPSLLSTMPLDTDHFHPRNQPVLLALRSAVADHSQPNVDQVLRELAKRDKLSTVGGGVYLAECLEHRALPGNLRWYVQACEAATMRRRAAEIGSRLMQMAGSSGDTDDLLDALSSQYTLIGDMLDNGTSSEPPIVGLSTVQEFMDEPTEPYRWVIPGILEHQDRCVITAGEGVGKSVLARQLALCVAGGRHPFMPKHTIPTKTTLLVDLENPPSLMRRNMAGILAPLTAHGVDLGDRCWRWSEPSGIDIRTTSGYRQLERVLDKVNPDLVCIGPVYKMSTSHGDKYEVEAAEVQQAIDRLRRKYGCAFFMEHHSAKGAAGVERSGEPFGSSYWLRWPEFGKTLTHQRGDEGNVYTLGRFRGDRDVRQWPTKLVKGAHPLVPWGALWDDVEDENTLIDLCQETER